MDGHRISMLGTGLIGDFYTNTLHGQRGRDRVSVVYSRSEGRGAAFRERWAIPESTTDLQGGRRAPGHGRRDRRAPQLPARGGHRAGGRRGQGGPVHEAARTNGRGGAPDARDGRSRPAIFGGYLEDLCYTPKTLKAIASVQAGAIGDVTWVRSRETHPGPHSAWFWDGRLTGGGAIIDLGCHCIEIVRNFVGKGNRPVEVLCHTDTLVHPIADEDNAVALDQVRVRRDRPVRGQLDVPRRDGPARRGRRDPRHDLDEPLPADRVRDVQRAGCRRRLRRRKGRDPARAGCSPSATRSSELGYVDMFSDMFRAIDAGGAPQETFYDGYVVNAIMDACYRSAKAKAWAPVELEWRGGSTPRIASTPETVRGPGRHQARDPAGRTAQAHPQGPGLGRLHRSRRGRVTTGRPDPWVLPASEWADAVSRALATRIAEQPGLVMCLPTGATPRPVYDRLPAALTGAGTSLADASVVLLDEYLGLPSGHPVRCDDQLRRQLLDRLPGPPASLVTFDVDGPDPDAACAAYDASIADLGGLDLVVLGLGTNGHVGMNEPGTPPDAPTRAIDLAPSTKVAARAYGADPPPERGVTLGLAGILAAREIWLLVSGDRKATILRRVLEGPVTTDVPASLLRGHPTCGSSRTTERLVPDSTAAIPGSPASPDRCQPIERTANADRDRRDLPRFRDCGTLDPDDPAGSGRGRVWWLRAARIGCRSPRDLYL